ncbi:MAG: cytochrome c biogenesis protein CcsA [Paludibacter sp.]|nr:cytochrome c biogenesis protein CcsA [Paludibacter sp.]
MKKLKDVLFSMLTSVVLLVIFGASIGYATFAENNLGTEHAREIVYNALWFEVLMVLLIINLLGSIFRYDLINKKKWSVLLFHLAFICMIIGAGITRYYGSEGMMHIRQGATSNEISSDKTSVGITAEYNGEIVEKTFEASFSEKESNDFSESVTIGGKTITVENELFVPNSVETIVPDEQGEPALSLFVMDNQNRGMDFILLGGETNQFDEISFAFEDTIHKADVSFQMINNELYFKSTFPIAKMGMMQKDESVLMPGEFHLVQQKTIYKAENVIFVLKTYMPKAKKNLTQLTPEMNKSGIIKEGKDAIIFKVSDGNVTKKVNVLSSETKASLPAKCQLNNVKVSISYGMLQQKLPFSITLNEFVLERYPGSNSPSSYASEITVTDTEMKTERPFRIYMNNILNYRGYRFFQSSYDQDERGTILSVSNDYWGTFVTYIGYFLMMLGMVWTLLNKNSRFRTVLKLSNELQKKRKSGKTLLIAGLLAFSGSMFAANTENSKSEHVAALSSLLIQDEAQGRIEPFNTFASDILRKISKQTSYNDMSAVEVLLGMSANPSNWQNEPIIKVANPQLAKELGTVNDYVSFNQLFDFDNGGEYRLKDKINQVYQKEQSTHNKYDKEIVNVDERVNICYQIYNGTMLALFPIPGHSTGKWNSAQPIPTNMDGHDHSSHTHSEMGGTNGMSALAGMGGMKAPAGMGGIEGKTPPPGMGGMSEEQINAMMGKTTAPTASAVSTDSPEMLLSNYLHAANEAFANGNWGMANEQLNLIKNYQKINGGNNIPSSSKISLEIVYNDFNIFGKLAITYALLGFLLLILHLIDIFKKKSGLEKVLNLAIYPFLVVFGVYTLGLAIRWYISDHAPWSNGYETIIFVGWAAALSGLLFARKSPITMAVTGILSAIALFVAGMSWMNPEITNLVPVLKSYWLIIHVAIITSSYGFLAMAALLGFLNLTLMIARSKKSSVRLKDSIQEISYIIELAMIIGLIMLTIGCFIGGIWANESWGRYWGWDPKETWALVSILVYATILHLRNVPKANNQFTLSSLSLIGFSTIIMTFFGVNYYLSGMHSYAQGTPPPIPSGVYIAIVVIIALVIMAYNAEKKNTNL